MRKTILRLSVLGVISALAITLSASSQLAAQDESKSADAIRKIDKDGKKDGEDKTKDQSQESKKEDAKKDEKKDSKKEETEVSFDGAFEAVKADEIELTPEEWSVYKIQKVVEHGDEVQAGDTLIEFETEKYELAVEAAEDDLKTSELSLESSRLDFDIAKESLPTKLKAAQTADRIATEELKEWLTGGRQRRAESSERSVESAQDRLAYQEEELKQLERMYKADDLTEETEEIILKRTRDGVKSAKYGLELAKVAHRLSKEFTVPRNEEKLKDAVTQASMALREAEENLPRKLRQQEIKLKQEELSHDEKIEKLKRLRADRKTLKITARRSGIVYFGKNSRGKWSDSSALAESLKEGGSATPKSVLMTIVEAAPLNLRVYIDEKSIRHVKVGTQCEVTTVAYPDEKLEGKIESLSTIPVSDGKFDATVEVQLGDLKGRLFPGMKGKATIQLKP